MSSSFLSSLSRHSNLSSLISKRYFSSLCLQKQSVLSLSSKTLCPLFQKSPHSVFSALPPPPAHFISQIQCNYFHTSLSLLRRGVFHSSEPRKRKTVAGVKKRFKVTGSGKLMRRGIGNSHLAWRKQSRRKRRMKHKKWVVVENKGHAKNITKFLGKNNYI
uniref:50S ribosomal protein L35 n=1 Tax=Percolomonas cosmopolitus TaxID=63605 RepID=A0A7S1KMN5_9EUKA